MSIRLLARRARIPRFTLRRLLLLFIPIAIVLTVYGYYARQQQLTFNAWQDITSRGVNTNHPGSGSGTFVIYFKNGNVTDNDLDAFVPAFNGYYAPMRFGRFRLELFGSKVSSEAIERFRRAVPECEIVP
jgi:hypothetical protein